MAKDKKRINKGCRICADAYKDIHGTYKCKHLVCPYEEKEALKWWQEVGDKILIPAEVSK